MLDYLFSDDPKLIKSCRSKLERTVLGEGSSLFKNWNFRNDLDSNENY